MASRNHLDGITDFPGLLTYLEEELDWPIDAAKFEEATFTYTPAELGLKQDAVGGPIEIRQLRPLVDGQPWGVFFLNLPQKKLSKTIVSNILGKLTVKKRAASNDPGRPAFLKSDLLFIASTGSDHDRRLAFAHFKDDLAGGNAATLELLGWDGDDTPRRVKLTESTLASRLHWPDNTADVEGWRKQWSGAFAHTDTHSTVRDVKAMAIALAALARRIRARATELIAAQTADGSMVKLHAAFKEALIHDLTPEGFADTYAQTVAYGLLSTAISRRSGALTQDDLPANVAGTSPFIKEMLATFIEAGGRRGGQDGEGVNFDELGVAEIVELLRKADMEAVLADFDRKNPDEDPVIHFYELFLKQYDPEQKVKRGVFYTPRPVVSFIVRSVDEVLRTEFGLADGLASIATWAEMIASRPEIKLPAGAKLTDPFVRILDPATGTGTFLVECVDLVHKTMLAKWKAAGRRDAEIKALWNEYVPKHLLPRLTGFELMMAPYAIAHVKLGLKLSDTGYTFGGEVRAQIYLTNALEPAQELDLQLAFMSDALAHEARAANAAKGVRYTVVLGNPPYSGISRNMGTWIQDLIKGKGRTGIEKYGYYEVDGKPLAEKKVWLQDDYVKFFRLSQFVVDSSGVGVVGLITNHSYLDNPTFRGMRQSLSSSFQCISVHDLHGNSRRGENSPNGVLADENVFDIEQGVAICVLRKNLLPLRVDHSDVWGTRSSKNAVLRGHLPLLPLRLESPFYFLTPGAPDQDSEFLSFPSLRDVFVAQVTGVLTARDTLAVQFSAGEAQQALSDFASKHIEDSVIRDRFQLGDNYAWKLATVRESVSRRELGSFPIESYGYRAFDDRVIIYDDQITFRTRREVMRHVKASDVSLTSVRQLAHKPWDHVLVTRGICDDSFLSSRSRERTYVYPLRRIDDVLSTTSNISVAISSRFASLTALRFDEYSSSVQPLVERGTFHARHIFDWIYAVLHSPAYRSRYADYLKSDFARIPLPKGRPLFQSLVPLGTELVALHLLDATAAPLLADPKSIRLAGAGDNRVTRKAADFENDAWTSGRMYISASQWFETVPERVADFHIGGYRPARKWLKDRTAKGGKSPSDGRVLTPEDILHYRCMIAAMDRTIDLMAEIDRVIDAHGGWPDAFRGMDDDA